MFKNLDIRNYLKIKNSKLKIMVIGIDASRAFQKERTGIEEYSYQVIKSLGNKLIDTQVILYVRKNQKIDLNLPKSWRVKVIKYPYLWTQVGLSLEMLFHPVDVLFVPAHVVPIIHPKKTIVTVHGLEYEFYPKAYSFWERLYMRWSIKNSCRWAKKIIAVSNNTKQDLIKLYKVPTEKIQVVYEGISKNFEFQISNFESPGSRAKLATGQSNSNEQISKPYLLFVGRLEERKNVLGIIEAYKILKEKYNIPHSLVLAGNQGFGYNKIKFKIQNSKFKIFGLGHVSDEKKAELFKQADVFLFPSFYEGFGLPILEAQSVGVPVVASNTASIPEVANGSALLVNPQKPEKIADAVYKLISDQDLRQEIISKGYENMKRFSWDKCAEEIKEILVN